MAETKTVIEPLILVGDCLEYLRDIDDDSIDAIITDPPYGLEFMGKDWDRPWAVTPSAAVGFEGREGNLTLPSHRDSRNANCRACGGRQRGAKRCECPSPKWDRSPADDMRAFQEWCTAWTTECLRVLKPGGHLLAFGGTRTWHRLACAVEDAGFEVRDSIAWLYGSGFPKSLDVSKAIDKAAGAQREVTGQSWAGKTGRTALGQGSGWNVTANPESHDITAPATPDAERWQGWGTALKPAFEPIVVARKPLSGTVAANVLRHGTGALNIDLCRVTADGPRPAPATSQGEREATRIGESSADRRYTDKGGTNFAPLPGVRGGNPAGRWPTNVVLDDSQAEVLDEQSGRPGFSGGGTKGAGLRAEYVGGERRDTDLPATTYGDTGGASRFFPTFRYQAKAPKRERPVIEREDGTRTAHPTVKPLELMRWLVRLVTPPGGIVLDPFAGSGTTVEAGMLEGFEVWAIEREADYLPLIQVRIDRVMAEAHE